MKVCLVGSSGGHLTHLYMLKPFWKKKDRFWVTFDKEDARSILEGEKVYHCYYPTNRNLKNLFRNTILALKVLRKERPDLLISSGAAAAVPFFYIARLKAFVRLNRTTTVGHIFARLSATILVMAYLLDLTLRTNWITTTGITGPISLKIGKSLIGCICIAESKTYILSWICCFPSTNGNRNR